MKPVFTEEREHFTIRGNLSEDRMKLFVDVQRLAEPKEDHDPEEELPPITKQDILEAISKHLKISMVHQGVLADIVQSISSQHEVLQRRICRGRPPKPGKTGKLVPLVKAFRAPQELEKETEKTYVNLRDLDLFDNLTAGQIVARVYPPTAGQKGSDALGNPLPAEAGLESVVALDDTLELVPPQAGKRYQEVRARCHGYLTQVDGKLHIESLLRIKSDLDYRYGNISFIGSIEIEGDVNPSFSVRATHDITVAGTVQRSSIHSEEGNIVIKGFVIGPGASVVASAGDVEVAGLSESTLHAQGYLRILKESRDGTLSACCAILAEQASIFGGEAAVLYGLEAKLLGNTTGIATHIQLCNNVEMSPEYIRIKERLKEHELAMETLSLHLGPYAKNPDRLQLLDSPFREKMEKLSEKLNQLARSRKALSKKEQKLLEDVQVDEKPRVNFFERIHAGVSISAGEEELKITEDRDGPASLVYSAESKSFESGDIKAALYSETNTSKTASTTSTKEKSS